MRDLSAEEFVSLIKGNGKLICDHKIIITDKVIINEECIGENKSLEIDNIEFKNEVIIEKIISLKQLFFYNCSFNKSITFRNSDFRILKANGTIFPNNIKFNHCLINHIAISNLFLQGNFVFENECKITNISQANSQFNCKSLVIRQSEVFRVFILQLKGGLNIFESKVKRLRAENITKDIIIEDSEFVKATFLKIECDIFSVIENTFLESFILDDFHIKNIYLNKNKLFDRGLIILSDYLSSLDSINIHTLQILSCEIGNQFNIYGDYNKAKIIDLEFELNHLSTGSFICQNLSIDKISISGINSNSNILFKNISSLHIYLENLTNNSDLNFSSIRGLDNSEFLIENSDLGTIRLNDVDFNSFNNVTIKNSAIYRIVTSNVNWFEDLQLNVEGKTEIEVYRNKREVYRQLKHALKINGNHIDSLKFYSLELKAFNDELKVSNKSDWKDNLVMKVASTNDFGLNWWKPTIILIVVTMSTYISILPLISNEISYCVDLNNFEKTIKVFGDNFDFFVKMFNPIRDLQLNGLEKYEINIFKVIDLFHRVFVGIMVFQIIRAFRKYFLS